MGWLSKIFRTTTWGTPNPVAAGFVILFVAAGMAFAEDVAVHPVTKSEKTIVEQTAESELERDNRLLRKENRALRRQVVALRSHIGEKEEESAAATKNNESANKAIVPVKSATEQTGDIGLEAENENIRKENQALRRQVVALRSRLGNAVAEDAAAEAKKKADNDSAIDSVEPDKELNEHWLSGSKKRHNSSCRYFKTGHGCLCTPTDGTPCKVCGG